MGWNGSGKVSFGSKGVKESRIFFLGTKTLETSFVDIVELTELNSYHMLIQFNKFLQLMKVCCVFFFFFLPASCSVLLWLSEDQPLCPDLPELDLSELDRERLGYRQLSGWTQWCSDQSNNNI